MVQELRPNFGRSLATLAEIAPAWSNSVKRWTKSGHIRPDSGGTTRHWSNLAQSWSKSGKARSNVHNLCRVLGKFGSYRAENLATKFATRSPKISPQHVDISYVSSAQVQVEDRQRARPRSGVESGSIRGRRGVDSESLKGSIYVGLSTPRLHQLCPTMEVHSGINWESRPPSQLPTPPARVGQTEPPEVGARALARCENGVSCTDLDERRSYRHGAGRRSPVWFRPTLSRTSRKNGKHMANIDTCW